MLDQGAGLPEEPGVIRGLSGGADYEVENTAGLCGQFPGLAMIVDHMIRHFSLGVKGHLGGFAAFPLVFVPVAVGLNPGEADFRGRVDEDDGVAGGMEAGFVEEGGVDDEGRSRGGGVGELLLAFVFDPGMGEGFEHAEGLGIGEDNGGDGGAIYFALVIENGVSPPLDELGFDGGVFEGLAAKLVGIADNTTKGSENFGNGAFSGAYSASESDYWRGRGRHGLRAGQFEPQSTQRSQRGENIIPYPFNPKTHD